MGKKIAFFVQHMLCGGVENALIALSDRLKAEGNDVTIYVISKSGELLDRVSCGVDIKPIPMDESLRKKIPVGGVKLSFRKHIKEHRYLLAVHDIKIHFLGKAEFAELNIPFEKIPVLTENYDIAVNFHMHSPFLVRYLSEKVGAEKKYTWIHNDFSTTHYNISALKQYLCCNNGFFAVSQRLINEFSEACPEFANMTELALNIVPTDKILEKGNEGLPAEYTDIPEGTLKILSVGRLEEQKGYDIAIKVCERLLKNGYKFKWLVLGEGSERHTLETSAKKAGIRNSLCFLGVRMNPYPYFKDCDIYVQTSRHEGYVTTVTEAKIFNRPIVCTDVSGAREQIEDGINGDIANIDENDIYERIKRLIDEPERRESYSNRLVEMKSEQGYPYMRIFK